MDLVLKKTGKRLKRLSIRGKFANARLQFLEHLSKASERQQEQQQQYGKTSMAQDLLTDESGQVGAESRDGHNSGQDHDNGGDFGFELEELLLKDIGNYSDYDYGTRWLKPDLGWIYDFPGILPLRVLTILNFETRPPDELLSSD